QVERLAYDAGKAAGRAAATTEANIVAIWIAGTKGDAAVAAAVAATVNLIRAAVQKKVNGCKADVIAELVTGATSAVGDRPPADAALLPDDVKTKIGNAVHASVVDRVTGDAELETAAKKAAKRQEKSSVAAVQTDVTADMQAQKDRVAASAVTAGTAAARQKGADFRAVRGQIRQSHRVADGGMGKIMNGVSAAIDAIIPDAGDLAEIDAMFEVPLPVAPPASVSFHFIGSAERAGGAAAKNEKLVTLKMELLVGIGGNLGFAKAFLELGGYIESCSDNVARAFEQIWYATYRRCRESSAVPSGIANSIWGAGGGSGKALGLDSGDSKRLEAEEWALGVEQRMADADRSADDHTVGKGAYVEGGGKIGLLADVGDGAGGFTVQGFAGQHMRPEGGGADAAVPTSRTSNAVFSGTKEKRGRGVKGLNFGANAKIGQFGGVDVQVSLKWFDLLPGETEADEQFWMAIDGLGKVNLAGVSSWAAMAVSAAAGLAHLVPTIKNIYLASQGKQTRMRAGGGALGVIDSTVSAIEEAKGNASPFMSNDSNALMTGADEGTSMGGETTIRLSFERRGKDKDDTALTIMVYQARKVEVNATGLAKVEAAAHKRLVQVNMLPTFGIELPGM
ncbi:MAG TPA: hypothetical protein VL172_15020, partial [Kofleriaceae bacterium]|nr:hypothetical protein [Kofleriaceae bacterium]